MTPVPFPKILALALLLAPAPALAGGFALPVRGVRALSMAGAQVAGGEEMSALWYNPSRLDDSALSLDVGWVALSAAFSPAAGDLEGRRVENQATPPPNPTAGGVWRVNDVLSLALGAYAPWGAHEKFDEDGPQRYVIVQNDRSVLLFVHAAAALRLGPLRIGGGVQNVVAHIQQRTVLSGYPGVFGHATDPELDILSEVDLVDPVTLTGNVGASFDAGPVTFGASVQLPFTVAGDASFRVRLPLGAFYDGVRVEGDRVRLAIPFPLIVRSGVAWRATQRWRLEVAASYEGWSVQQDVTLDPQGGIRLRGVPAIGDYAMPAIVVERQMRDTLSLHAGTDVEVAAGLHLRGGAFYEPSAFGDATFSLAQPDDRKAGLCAGASYAIGSMRVDLGLGRVMPAVREVSTSELKQLNPANPSQAAVVGNGTYETSYWLGGLGLTWLL